MEGVGYIRERGVRGNATSPIYVLVYYRVILEGKQSL